MSRDSRAAAILDEVKRLAQYEEIYARMAYPVSRFQREDSLSSFPFQSCLWI